MSEAVGAVEVLEASPADAVPFALALLMGGLCLVRFGFPRLERWLLAGQQPDEVSATWGVAELLLVVGVIMVSLTAFINALGSGASSPVLVGMFATQLGLLMGTLTAGVLACRLQGRRSGLRAMGWAPGQPLARPLALGAFELLLVVPCLLGLMTLVPFIFSLLGHEVVPQQVLEGVLAQGGAALVAAIVMASLTGPVLEEVLFRGFLQPMFCRVGGGAFGVVVTSLIFASIHGLDAGIPVFCLSLLLGYLRLRTGLLAVPALAHCLWNGVTLFCALVHSAPSLPTN